MRQFDVLMLKYGTDLYLTAHCHDYYRLKKQTDFVNHTGEQGVRDPLRVVNGVAGCDKKKNAKGELVPDMDRSNHTFAEDMADFIYTDSDSAYLELTTSPTKISGKLLRSKDLKVLDQFELDKADRSGSNSKKGEGQGSQMKYF